MRISGGLTQPLGDSGMLNSGTVHTIPARGKMRAPVRIYASRRLMPDERELAALTRLAKLPYVEQVVALPDLHLKPKLETPSSLAAATREHLVLGLSSPSPNCGMALAKTGLHLDDLSEERLDALFSHLASRFPLEPASPVLSSDEAAQILVRGAAAAVKRYGLSTSTYDYMEQGGDALAGAAAPDGLLKNVLRAVPASLREAARWRFGQVGKGNHFLELQAVEKIHDRAAAAAWGLEEGQLVVMYHADSGYLGAFVGRLYAYRSKNTWRGRQIEWRAKLPFHLFNGNPLRLPQRMAYHLLPRRLAPIPAGSPEGGRAWLALQAAANYAYANRLAILAGLRDALIQVWGAGALEPELLWDAPHNSIRREYINDRMLWVHRHNAARVEPPSLARIGSPFASTGHPVLLPGTERTWSYLCAAGEGAAGSLHSAGHGAGRAAMRLAQALSHAGNTRIYGYEGKAPVVRPHLSSDGLEEVLSILHSNDIARPVAALRPLAVLKAGD